MYFKPEYPTRLNGRPGSWNHVRLQSQAPLQLRRRVHSPTGQTQLYGRQDSAGPRRPLSQFRRTSIETESTHLRLSILHRDQVSASRRELGVSPRLRRVRRRRRCDDERVRGFAEDSGLHLRFGPQVILNCIVLGAFCLFWFGCWENKEKKIWIVRVGLFSEKMWEKQRTWRFEY